MRFLIALAIALAWTATTDAQLFRRNVNYGGSCYSYPVAKKAYIPVANNFDDDDGDTIIINNNIPGPIGGTGQTLYGYEQPQNYSQVYQFQSQQLYSLDPSQLMREAARLTDNAGNLHSQALIGFQTSADQLAKSALDNQKLALASNMLEKLGLNQPLTGVSGVVQNTTINRGTQTQNLNSGSSGGQSLPAGACLRICPDGNGGLMISIDQGGQASSAGGFNHPGMGIFQAKCLQCHGAGSNIPFIDQSGALSIDGGMRDKIINMARSGQMPPADKGLQPLSDDEFLKLEAWLKSL